MQLSIVQAYAAAYLLIANKWRRKYGEPDGPIEDDIELFLNGMNGDPALEPDWSNSVRAVIGDRWPVGAPLHADASIRLNEREAYDAVVRFLERYYLEGERNDVGIGELLQEMRSAEIPESEMWTRWLESAERTLHEPIEALLDSWP